MTRRTLVNVPLVLLLAGLCIGSVNARGGSFIVAPWNEVTEKVQLGVTDKVFGNVSVSNGFIDFFVTNPSNNLLFYGNKTSLETFNFTADEKGIYVMHIVNNYQTENVNVTLSYALSITIVLTASVTLSTTVSATTISAIVSPTNPIDWIELLRTIVYNIPWLGTALGAIVKFLKWLRWKIKYRRSRTPVVIVGELTP